MASRHQFTPRQFQLDIWRTDVRGSDFALVTLGPSAQPLEGEVLDAPEAFTQRHMVHCSALGLALDNGELGLALVLPPLPPSNNDGSDTCQPSGSGNAASDSTSRSGASAVTSAELRLQAQAWPPQQEDLLLADLDADVLRTMTPAAQAARPGFIWLSALPDDADAADLGASLRAFLLQLLGHAAGAYPALAPQLTAFVEGGAAVGAHAAFRHPSWPSDGELAFELAATHAAAAAGSSPAFSGDAPGGPLQLELGLAAVVQRYAAARGCPTDAVQLLVLGTRQFREKRQHALVMCTAGDGGLGAVFDRPLQPVQQYNRQQQEEAGEVVVQPDSDGRGLTWWLQSSMGPVPEDEERSLPWKTWLNLDPAALKGAPAVTAAAHSLGNSKWDALEVGLYFPAPGATLAVPVCRVRLRRAAALRPTPTGSVPRPEEGRVPSEEAVGQLVAAGVPLVAAPELVQWLREGGEALEGVLRAVQGAGAIRSPKKPSPAKEAGAGPSSLLTV